MELDELKERWAEQDRKLDRSIRLNLQLLRETCARRARFALWRLAAMLAAGALFMLAVIVSLGRFIALNWWMPRFVWPAVVLDLMAIAVLAALIAQIALAFSIDYGQPVAVIQKRLETLRKLRIRYIQWICLTGAMTWALIFVVLTKALRFDTHWIVINVAIGIAVPVLVIWVFRTFAPWMSPRFLKELAGYNLNAASGFMATLAEFAQDHSPQERSSMREYSPDE